MRPGPRNHLRLARPSRDLAAAERFWCGGLGLDVLWRSDSDAVGGHALLMLGWPDSEWHLELVGDPDGHTPPANPCWDEHGVTVQDPDGYHLVLSRRSWG